MKRTTKYILIAVLCLIVIGAVYFFVIRQPANPSRDTAIHSCISQRYNVGSSGNCVSDIQTMVNFMETDGLTQCPFTGSSKLNIDGTYDTATADQVRIVQAWLNCYNREEGQPVVNTVDGIVGSTTWSGLCTYAFQFPSQAHQSLSPYLTASIAAGKNAGC